MQDRTADPLLQPLKFGAMLLPNRALMAPLTRSRAQHQDDAPHALNARYYAQRASAGLVSDRVSLGFVAATEQQVCRHLQQHLFQLPEQDVKSRAVIEQMLDDEARHGDAALAAGGMDFPAPVKLVMTLASKVMTISSYRI